MLCSAYRCHTICAERLPCRVRVFSESVLSPTKPFSPPPATLGWVRPRSSFLDNPVKDLGPSLELCHAPLQFHAPSSFQLATDSGSSGFIGFMSTIFLITPRAVARAFARYAVMPIRRISNVSS